MRPFTKVSLGMVTAATMATSTFAIIVTSVVAPQWIDEFEISRAQLGLVPAVIGLVGACASPVFGHLTDRIGAVPSMIGALVTGGVGLVGLAASPAYALLAAAAVICGLANGWGNPATNTLIVENVAAGARGIVTGVKQSGVQAGAFLGGLLIPVFTGWWTWRAAVLIFLVIPGGGLIAMLGRPHIKPTEPRQVEGTARGGLPTVVRWVAGYGFISGLATSAILGFLPLFAHESLGWTEAAGGSLVAITGLTGVIARIAWPRTAEKSLGHGRTLRILSWMTVGAALLLWLVTAGALDEWFVPVAALLTGAGAVAWNAVGMLAVMDLSPSGLVGKGTGVVLFGFLLGLALGPFLMGLAVDTFGTYQPGWLAAAGLLAVSGVLARQIPSAPTGRAAPQAS